MHEIFFLKNRVAFCLNHCKSCSPLVVALYFRNTRFFHPSLSFFFISPRVTVQAETCGSTSLFACGGGNVLKNRERLFTYYNKNPKESLRAEKQRKEDTEEERTRDHEFLEMKVEVIPHL